MMDMIKTSIVVVVILILMAIVFLVIGNIKYDKENIPRNELIENEPTVSLLFDRIENQTINRKAKLINDEMSTVEVTKYILENLDDKDKNIKKYKGNKEFCVINSNILFETNANECNVLILNSEQIMSYQKKYFGIEKKLEYEDFQYKGYTCKSGEDEYYCLINKYNDYIYGYSAFDSAYEGKNMVVIKEYYFQIDVSDNDKCLMYFDEEYCNNYTKKERPYLDKDIIKENGVLYKHIFRETSDNYYLENSFIVSER